MPDILATAQQPQDSTLILPAPSKPDPPPAPVQPTRKGTNKAVILTILIILLGTLPLGVYFVSQQGQVADVRSKAAYTGNEELEHEPNDEPDQATEVKDLNQKHRGTIKEGEVDFWKVSLAAGSKYQLQMVKDDNDKDKNKKKSGTGNDFKDELRFALLDSDETVVVEPSKKNFSYTVPDDAEEVHYVKVTSLHDEGLLYKFVLKDLTGKEPKPTNTPTPTPVPSCESIKLYDASGADITQAVKTGTTKLNPGQLVILGTPKGQATKARFRIQGIADWAENDPAKTTATEYRLEIRVPTTMTQAQGTFEVEVFVGGVWK